MKGSQWNKWNPHVHIKGTNKNDQFSSPTTDDFFHLFFKKAIEKNVKAVGITDYFSIDRYIEGKQYVENIQTKTNTNAELLFNPREVEFVKGMFIFPNVELRMLPTTGSSRLINIHCLFNPDYVNSLDNDFFNHIENQDGEKMNRSGFIAYGKKLDSTLTSEDALYKKGMENFVVDPRHLKDLLKRSDFKRNTLVVVSNSKHDGNSGFQHYDMFETGGSLYGIRNSIYKMSNAIFSANKKDFNYFLGKRLDDEIGISLVDKQIEIQRVISEQGSLKACLVGCDAHKEDELFTRYTWIKSDLNFNGLKQIIYEPEHRVKVQDQEPDFKEDRLIIDEVRFISTKGQFTPEPIPLNKNLNVIIGGISSGKSILLYNIAKTLLADRNFLKEEGIEDKYKFKQTDLGYNFEIKTKGGFLQQMYRPTTENSIIPEIKYIPQNYLVKLAEPNITKKGDALNKMVRKLINEDPDSAIFYGNFISKVQSNDRNRESIIDNYFELRYRIVGLENILQSKASKEVLLKNIETNSKLVEELNQKAGLAPEEIEKYNTLQSRSEHNRLEQTRANNDFHKLVEFNREIIQSLTNLKNRKILLENSLENEHLKKFFTENYTFIDNMLSSTEQIASLFELTKNENGDSVFKNNNPVSEIFTTIFSTRRMIESELQPYLANNAIKEQIESISKSISVDREAIQAIDQLKKEILDLRTALDIEKKKLFTLYEDNYLEYLKVIEDLKPRTEKLAHDNLQITGLAKFNFPKFREIIYGFSDGRTASYNSFDICCEDYDALKSIEISEHVNGIVELFESIVESSNYALKTNVDKKDVIKKIFDDYFFDYWLIEYKDDKLGAMSAGKASFVILMLIVGLSKSKAPILIDQPEDNLDNRSITSDLVEYLRNKKLERQIILVTHNPNVVVNADAENIIVACQKGQNDIETSSPFQFDYINGSLENSFPKNKKQKDLLKSMGIKEHIAEIVEGGKEAFIKREKKYGFSV